jgi:hypothetical protein
MATAAPNPIPTSTPTTTAPDGLRRADAYACGPPTLESARCQGERPATVTSRLPVGAHARESAK